ncbi:RluA family pseudouridine synthase [Candidatus Peregrinibacteria bacterium]|nr:RluA family pseudouridine synthase [Candidatus Peregrinibacteria bacterium]MBI3816753.1 RluA family pseudouridine synthase [Candidatus Peregrinibacteria bacterium]
MPQWIVSQPNRLDSFLASQREVISRSKAQKSIEEGQVRVNDDVITKPAQRLQEGDRVTLIESDVKLDATIAPRDLHLPILYEDDECFVIDKPAGIAVHPGAGMIPGEKTILHDIAFLYDRWHLPFSAESVLVHRLDKETTGCLLIAKNPRAHLELQKQFESRTVQKRYLALVAGVPSPASAMIDSPIGRSTSNRTVMAVSGSAQAREAQTTYRTLRSAQGKHGSFALIECELHTGRTHQIRVHLSAIGHPVLGDGTYTNELSERIAQEFDISILCLHAWKLAFESPNDHRRHDVESPLPFPFQNVLKRIGIESFEE